MSSIFFYTDENQVWVATDTLAVHEGGHPFMYTSKAQYIPHLETIIAGTGTGAFASEWCMRVNNNMIVSGVEHLDFHTPDELRKLWIDFQGRDGFSERMTTTVYAFGLSPDTGTAAFAYRSTNSFSSERLTQGSFGIKPACALPEGSDLDEITPALMRAQRDGEDARPAHQRLYIGGDCIVLHLTSRGCMTRRLYRFDDFDSRYQQMLSNCVGRR